MYSLECIRFLEIGASLAARDGKLPRNERLLTGRIGIYLATYRYQRRSAVEYSALPVKERLT